MACTLTCAIAAFGLGVLAYAIAYVCIERFIDRMNRE